MSAEIRICTHKQPIYVFNNHSRRVCNIFQHTEIIFTRTPLVEGQNASNPDGQLVNMTNGGELPEEGAGRAVGHLHLVDGLLHLPPALTVNNSVKQKIIKIIYYLVCPDLNLFTIMVRFQNLVTSYRKALY